MERSGAVATRKRKTSPEQARVNAALIAEIERIAQFTRYQHRDDSGRRVANQSALAQACGLSRGGFDQIYAGGGTTPPTLLALAKFAQRQSVPGYEGPQPQRRLFRILGWWDEDSDQASAERTAPDGVTDDGGAAPPRGGNPRAREAWEIFGRADDRRQDVMIAVLREIELGWQRDAD